METEVFWRAVKTRDAKFDGAFVFGVRTTGIFCRPSCRARKPKRENVEFFDGVDSARIGGFRACLRCRPAEVDLIDAQVGMILRACEMIGEEAALSLEDLSERLGVSPSHFQRTFKEIVGVSPKKYAEARKMDKFKSELRGGSDVITAMYDAGYGSSSRLYEKAAANLGMTPAVYRKGGKGMKINYVITETELGPMLVARTMRGICSVTFGDKAEDLEGGLRIEFPNAEITEDANDLGSVVIALVGYLAGKTRRLVLPLDLHATAFQMQVWDLLRKIPYGETRSYSEIAEALGDKKKVRAVAGACAKNRVALVIPCHRVVASNGNLSGYRWGTERKKKLLERERAG
jgi:AraC family transcriptional regulator of adaptative response/methylated-DNA-[protein]-cysteine methyltransferase